MDEVGALRRELLAHVERHPFRDWSARLLAAVIAVVKVEFGDLPEPDRRVVLTVVR